MSSDYFAERKKQAEEHQARARREAEEQAEVGRRFKEDKQALLKNVVLPFFQNKAEDVKIANGVLRIDFGDQGQGSLTGFQMQLFDRPGAGGREGVVVTIQVEPRIRIMRTTGEINRPNGVLDVRSSRLSADDIPPDLLEDLYRAMVIQLYDGVWPDDL